METAKGTFYPRFLGLPTEILSLIFDRLRRSDLKNVRLCCSFTKTVAEMILFDEVVVVPHQMSLKGLMDLSEHATLRNHVQRVSYENRWGNVALHLLEDAKERTTDKSILDALAELSRGTIAEGDAPAEFAYLSRAFSSLPSLRGLYIWERPTVPEDLPWLPGLYQRFERLAGGNYAQIKHSIGRTHFSEMVGGTTSVLSSLFAARKSMELVEIDFFDCELCCGGPVRQLTLFAFQPVRSLTLKFRANSLLLNSYPASNFGSILCALRSLEELELDLSGNWLDEEYTYTSALLEERRWNCNSPSTFPQLFPPTLHFPKLERLSLAGVFVTEKDLLAFLKRHASKLSYLSLQDAVLCDQDDHGTHSCWVRTLKRLQTSLNLEEMNLEGNLENEGTQCWWVDDTGGPDSFKARMEDFVVQGGECPFDDAIVIHSGSEFFLDDKSWEIGRTTDGNQGDD